ncbi:MAG: undecaprenyl-diphosphatase UppP [Elusimicrobia bacterium]|nr:undecaprenyl-diphosphatase UppP [Elusimicrobiota bacterium]
MTIIQSIILGFIQGVGEFLPISSSGHLIAVPQLLGWADHGLVFDIALHWGTLAAVMIYFWQDWILLIRSGWRGTGTRDGKMFWFLIVAAIPGAIAGYLLDNIAETYFRNVGLVGSSLIIMGMIMYLCDRYGRQDVNFKQITFWQSLWIGFSQALAIIPGVSRSGSTISCARILGLDRESAARFSFLLSTPIIFGSAIVPLKKLFQQGLTIPLVNFAAGMLTAAILGLLCIRFFLQYLKKSDLVIFVWYRFVFGVILLLFYYTR